MSLAINWKNKSFLIAILFLHLALYLAIFFNIPVFRPIIGFAYLTFVPGIVILKLLRLGNIDTTEKILFSVGLSIAFLMFIGVFINEIMPLAGITHPLSLNPLIISITTISLLISLIGARHHNSNIQLKNSKFLFFIVLSVFLLLLGIYGIIAVNNSKNNFFLLLLILIISIIIPLSSLSEKLIPPRFYPLILIVVCLSLLFFVSSDTALITNYLIGRGDQWIEYYSFELTNLDSRWDSALAGSSYTPTLFPTYSMASVTILPTIFVRITGLDGSLIFKLIYPFIVSFIALGTYKLYRTRTEKDVAFLATFFLITVCGGKGWGSAKQMVAQLFFVLLFLLLFKREMPRLKKSILFIIFSAGLVISHYSLSYIFMFIIFFTWLALTLMNYRGGISSIFQTKISFNLVLIFLTISFSWYLFVNASEAFHILMETTNTVVRNLNQFFNLESRGTALQGLGFVQTPTIFHRVSSFLFYLTEFLIFLGFIRLIMSKKKVSNFSLEYKIIATLNLAIIALNILLPRLADTFLMGRFYRTTLIILAPLAILGGKTILERIPKINLRRFSTPILVFIVIVPFFMFQTGFIYEITKVNSESLPLSMHRWDQLKLYDVIVNAQEVVGAKWLSKYANVTNIFVYSDMRSKYSVLTAYGMMGRGRIFALSNTTRTILNDNEFIYLRRVNVVNGKIVVGYIFNASEISSVFENQNKIYSNGECEVYKGYIP